MANPLNFPDFDGRAHVEPSIASRFRVSEAARFTGDNPFTATLLASHPAGDPDEVLEYPSLGEALDALDPERVGGAGAVLSTFAFRPSPDPAVRGTPTLRAIRLGAGAHVPTQATLALLDVAGATVATLTGLEYGLLGNRLRAKVEAAIGSLTGTAQAGAAGTITLQAATIAANGDAKGWWVLTTGGTGAGQIRQITQTVANTQVASITPNWGTAPDNTTTYVVFSGVRLLVGYKDTPAFVRVGNNLGPLFNLRYTSGAVAATVTITVANGSATRLQTSLNAGAAGTQALDLDLTTAEFDTVGKVLNYINRQPGYSAVQAVTDLDVANCPSSQMDAAANMSILPAVAGFNVTAMLGAIVQWANANLTRIGPIKGVSAARAANATAPVVPMAAFSDFTGGTQPAVDSTDYDAALDVLDREEVPAGCIFLDTSDATVRELVQTWIDEQRAKGRMWRASYATAAATTDADAKVIAGKIANTRMTLAATRLIDPAVATVTHNPIVAAAALAGMVAGINAANDVQTAVVTSKRVRFGGILKADKRTKEQREALLSAGVNVFREERGAVLLALAVTCDQGPLRTWRMLSESVVIDLIQWSVEQAIKPLNVAWGTPQYLGMVRNAYQTVMNGWANPQNPVISAGTDPVTGEFVPAFTPAKIVIANGQTTLTFELGFVGESDHVRIDAVVRKINLSAA